MRCIALAFVVLILPAVALAQGGEAFAGEWKSVKETKGIVGARVYREGRGWMLQLLGACTPTPCIWDPEPLVIVARSSPLDGTPRATATINKSNMRRIITLRPGEDTLLIEVASRVLAVPDHGIAERRYTSTDELTRVKATTTPLPLKVPPSRRR